MGYCIERLVAFTPEHNFYIQIISVLDKAIFKGTLAPKRRLVPGFPVTLISTYFIEAEQKIAILTSCV